jgi:ubiquinone/menaquinone biosynthesis C-methylase UbiE
MERMDMSDSFYERETVIHEVVEAKRSEICYNLIVDLIKGNIRRKGALKILDVGCGDGGFVVRFKKFCEVWGLDISRIAVKKALNAGVNAYVVDVSSQRLPFPDRFFDIVYMGDVIEHLVNPDFAVEEVARIIKTDGYMVLSTPNLASWLNRLILLFGMQPLFSEVSTLRQFGRFKGRTAFSVGHLRLFTYRALKEFLEYYGFKVLKFVGAPCMGLPKMLSWIDQTFSKIPSLSSIVVVVCVRKDRL